MSAHKMTSKEVSGTGPIQRDDPGAFREGETARKAAGIRTLIVEDEESFLGVLVKALESADRFETVPCGTGEDATKLLASDRFDLVILDHKLPGLSGLNVLQWMHEQKLQTPVIMLTGAGSETLAAEAMKLGAYDYLRKEEFDRRHFPITAYGVYERFLFREQSQGNRNQGLSKRVARNLSSLDSLHQSISSLTLNVNSSVTAIALVIEDCQEALGRLPKSEERSQMESHFDDLRQEYSTVSKVTKSLAELMRLAIQRIPPDVSAE